MSVRRTLVIWSVLVLLATGCGGGGPTAVETDRGSSVGPSQDTAVPPLDGLNQVTAVGGSFLFYGDGGTDARVPRAALLDPTSSEWRVVPTDPFDGVLLYSTAVETQKGFLLIGTLCTSLIYGEDTDPDCTPGRLVAASFDLATDEWTEVQLPEHPGPGDGVASAPLERAFAIRDGGRVLLNLAGAWFSMGSNFEATALGDLPFQPTSFCDTGSGALAVYAPNGDEFAYPLSGEPASEIPDTTVFSAAMVGDDGSWSIFDNPENLGEVASSELVLCTSGGVTVVGKDAGEPTFALSFAIESESWTQASLPPAEIGYPESWPLADGALLNDPQTGTFILEPDGSVRAAADDIGAYGILAVLPDGRYAATIYPLLEDGSGLGDPELRLGETS
jgi:hypothetical protein